MPGGPRALVRPGSGPHGYESSQGTSECPFDSRRSGAVWGEGMQTILANFQNLERLKLTPTYKNKKDWLFFFAFSFIYTRQWFLDSLKHLLICQKEICGHTSFSCSGPPAERPCCSVNPQTKCEAPHPPTQTPAPRHACRSPHVTRAAEQRAWGLPGDPDSGPAFSVCLPGRQADL